ncbi:cobalt/nickel transport system permease protein [Halarsenatibacter silvermanii]|uniref:Cobalt/nickel transport system permease protein n=2 Tax=Halarsenatibacter silvermanii TaxID=321763 RepID=A0A1G9QMW4_9FIRM|nr:cobalt/nickel transport system permease protein [Halarsenatibacter silvermanii]
MAAGTAGVAVGLKNMNEDQIPRAAIVSAALFVASLIHVPLGPSSVHLILNGIAGILLGWVAFPAMLVALFLQAVLFQHGGFTVLGVNLVNVALPAVLAGYLFRLVFAKSRANKKILGAAAALSGALAVLLTVLMVVLTLILSDAGAFSELAGLIFVSHLPVIIIEGFLSGMLVVFVLKVKPGIMRTEKLSAIK